MGWMDEEIAAWRASAEYARSQDLLRDLGPRTDLERVVIACHNDIVLAEQHEEAGCRDWTFFVEITGTAGIPVAEVFMLYRRICHAIVPDNATSIPWREIAGQTGAVVLQEAQDNLERITGKPSSKKDGADHQ